MGTTASMKILTFNHHESYLCALALTGHDFDVVCRYKDLDLSWAKNQKALPKNMRLVDFDDHVRSNLKTGKYDAVICHTLKNLMWLFWYRNTTYVFAAHIPLFFTSVPLFFKSSLKKMSYLFFKSTHRTLFVADSEFKRKMWREEGESIVLTPGDFPPIPEGVGYKTIINVGNRIKERGEELGFRDLEPLLSRFPIQVIGNNPEIKGAFKPEDFQQYQSALQKGRIYLYTVRFPHGDGYNTAMLEAMKMGMAVVTIKNPSSPIKHGHNGLVGENAQELGEHLRYLLEHPKEVDRMGQKAAETIDELFSNKIFKNRWNRVLASIGSQPRA